MTKLEQKIVDWNLLQFPRATEKAFLLKLKEELQEAIDDIDNGAPWFNIALELADVCIVGMCWLYRCHGWTLKGLVERKFRTVVTRKYGKEDENGDRVRL